jgi:hypothetical protein
VPCRWCITTREIGGAIDFPDNYTVRSELPDVPWSQMTEQTPVALSAIIDSLRIRYWSLNLHYEAAWTESWSHRRCMHQHQTLIDAAKCAMPRGAGWYVFAVECGTPRELSDVEDEAVNNFRFGDVPFLQKFLKQIGART